MNGKEEAIAIETVLNEALKLDPKAMKGLFDHELNVICDEEVGKLFPIHKCHGPELLSDNSAWGINLLGLVMGIFEAMNFSLSAELDPYSLKITGFRVFEKEPMNLKDRLDTMIKALNDLLRTDPMIINTFFNLKVTCNKEMAEHPTIQVGEVDLETGEYTYNSDNSEYRVGLLGLMNGFLMPLGYTLFVDCDLDKTMMDIKKFHVLSNEEYKKKGESITALNNYDD